MIKPITFCIPTAKNEKDYVLLLIESLQKNTNVSNHEILIFVDSDNQNTYEALIEKKKELPNIKIHRNISGFQVGGQRNISIMFDAAKNDIVCYLHSDMVVGKDFDIHILKNIIDDRHIISCGRIEPPLHPSSPEKIVKDFGFTPNDFKWDEFNSFVSELQKENRPHINGTHGAFAIYKKTWFDVLGGYDPQFRCSSEDYDLVVRIRLNGITEKMVWNACTYHFTCVSSRGKDWFKQDNSDINYKNILQEYASREEHKRFIRKWGFFSHNPRPVYDVGLFIDMDIFVDINLLEQIEPYFKNIYINNISVTNILQDTVKFKSSYYANLRWGYTDNHWNENVTFFENIDIKKRIQFTNNPDEIKNDSIMKIKFSDIVRSFTDENYRDIKSTIQNSHLFIDSYDVGKYELIGLEIDIREKNDISKSLIRSTIIENTIKNNNFEFL